MGGCRLTARAQVGVDEPSEAEGLPLRFSPVLNTALTYQISTGPERKLHAVLVTAALINRGFWPLKWSKRNGYLKKACTVGDAPARQETHRSKNSKCLLRKCIFQVKPCCSMPLIETTSTPWLLFSKIWLTYFIKKITKW